MEALALLAYLWPHARACAYVYMHGPYLGSAKEESSKETEDKQNLHVNMMQLPVLCLWDGSSEWDMAPPGRPDGTTAVAIGLILPLYACRDAIYRSSQDTGAELQVVAGMHQHN